MSVTARLGLVIPAQGLDPWFTEMLDILQSIDTQAAPTPVLDDKGLAALDTPSDGSKAFTGGITRKPARGSLVRVFVGQQAKMEFQVGDGVKTKSCYFSADAGGTARSFADIDVADTLHWNPSIAGVILDPTDKISLHYVSEV